MLYGSASPTSPGDFKSATSHLAMIQDEGHYHVNSPTQPISVMRSNSLIPNTDATPVDQDQSFGESFGQGLNSNSLVRATGSGKSGEIDADRLARKRALDRKSQSAMRERTRCRIEILEKQLAALTQSCDERISSANEEKSRLEAENEGLRRRLNLSVASVSVQWSGQDMSPENASVQLDVPNLEGQLIPTHDQGSAPNGAQERRSLPAVAIGPAGLSPLRTSSIFHILQTPSISGAELPSRALGGVHQAVPFNSEPVCLSDQIIHDFIIAQENSPNDYPSALRRPNISPLFMPETKTFVHPVSQVVTDILRAFNDMATIPEQVAGLYLMFKLLNWRILRNRESYEDMPDWIQPLPIQLLVAHPAWMDNIPWPRARAYMISKQEQFNFEDFSLYYSSSLSVSWPYNPADVVINLPSRSIGDDMVVNPVFEQHLAVLKHWKVGGDFKRKFPVLCSVISSYD